MDTDHAMRSSARIPSPFEYRRALCTMFRCDCVTSLGRPVDPEVEIKKATSPGSASPPEAEGEKPPPS